MTLRTLLHSTPARYAVSIVLVAGATVLTDALPAEVERRNSTLFFGAVMVSAWWGGLGPGLVSTALAAGTIAYSFTPPIRGLALAVDDQIRVSLFVAIAGLISHLNGARERAEARHAELLRREKVGRARSEPVEWRYTALADAAALVARSRDHEAALGRLARLAVPRFAVAVAVHESAAAGARGAAGDVDAFEETVVDAVSRAMETGHTQSSARTIVVPLVAGGRTVGATSFLAAADGPFRDDDLPFAQDLAQHAAVLLARVRTSP
ncbi:MAG: DUF4118 domain-containing protein [Candidatus Rokubacteria bacterium]|nr:DUF4118 domain-containing protein [Candidatus Rokubacteria bacterium]